MTKRTEYIVRFYINRKTWPCAAGQTCSRFQDTNVGRDGPDGDDAHDQETSPRQCHISLGLRGSIAREVGEHPDT
jgi:hypothetical protein